MLPGRMMITGPPRFHAARLTARGAARPLPLRNPAVPPPPPATQVPAWLGSPDRWPLTSTTFVWRTSKILEDSHL